MKNLENYDVQTLNAKEIKEIDGGGWQAFLLGVIMGSFNNLANANNDANDISLIDNKFA